MVKSVWRVAAPGATTLNTAARPAVSEPGLINKALVSASGFVASSSESAGANFLPFSLGLALVHKEVDSKLTLISFLTLEERNPWTSVQQFACKNHRYRPVGKRHVRLDGIC
jgi:hypothetical protein